MKSNIFKKLISSALALSMLLSTPLTSLATSSGVDGDSQGNNAGGNVTSSGGDFGVNAPTGRIGIRLSLVDSENPENVISVDQNGNSTVVDLLYVDEDTYIEFMYNNHATNLTAENEYSSVKTQSLNTKNRIIRIDYPMIKAGLDNNDVPQWASYHDGAYYSEGEDFVRWCIENEQGKVVLNEDGNIVVTINSKGETIQVKPTDTGNLTTTANNGANLSSNLGEETTKNYKSYSDYLKSKGTTLFNAPGGIDADTLYGIRIADITLMKHDERISDDEYNKLLELLDSYKVQFDAGKVAKNDIFNGIRNMFTPMEVYATEITDESIGNTSNTVTSGSGGDNNEGTKTDERAWINRIMDAKDNSTGEPYLKTPSMWEAGTNNLKDATEKWVLLVEPLIYLTIFAPGDDTKVLLPKQYGTVSNIADAVTQKLGGSYATKAQYGTFNWKALNGPLWGALSVSDAGFNFNNGWRLAPCNDYGKYVSFNELSARNTWKDGTSKDGKPIKVKSGYGVNAYWKGALSNSSDSSIISWDDINYSDAMPGPAPDASNLPDESEYKEENKKFKVVKWYYMEDMITGKQEVFDVKVRNNTPHSVYVVNEGDLDSQFYWEVENWGTGKENKVPSSGDTNSTYEDYWNSNKGTYTGTEPSEVVVSPEDGDKVLYVKLVFKVIEKEKTPEIKVVKFFPDTSPKIETIDKTTSYDAKEPGYVYVEDKQTPDRINPTPDSWDDTPSGDLGTIEKIVIKDSTKTVYIHYETTTPATNIMILHQNEIAKTFTLESLNSLISIVHNFQNKEKSGSGDHGYYEEDSDGDSYWVSDWRTWYRQISDSYYGYLISNHNNYGSTTFIGSQGAFTSQETGTVTDSGTLGMSGGNTNGLTPNLKFSIYRDSAKDNVTLYPNKNSSVKGELAQIGITNDSYIPANKRVQKEGTTQWYSQFTTNYVYDTEDNTLSWDSTCSEHGDSGSWNGTSMSLSDLNKVYSAGNNVLSKAFLGKAGKGEDKSSLTPNAFNILSKDFNKNLSYATGGDKFISFYPYFKMTYETVADDTDKNAYITSENISEVRNNSAVEVGVYRSKLGYGIDISSEQWSNHARAIEGLKLNGVTSKVNMSLIPGGATIDLKSANSSSEAPEVWVGIRAYELSVPDSLASTLNSKDGVKTTSEAKANIAQFTEEAKEILSHYQLEKWILPGISTNEVDLNGGTKVSGISAASSFGGNTLSKDSKYYLKNDTSDVNSAKFDVLNTQTEQLIYNISSDTQGRVSVKKDGTEIASSNIKKDKSLSSLLSNADVKRMDDRTKLVTNFIKSLDFEGGSDRNSQPWYYEAQDGLEAVETMIAIQIGFGGSVPIRSEVVDPKLTGKLDSKSDILNFNGETLTDKTRTVQYRMSDRSLSSKASGKGNNYIGTFNGLDIAVPGMNTVMRTRLTYMGNNTVQDLN